MGPSGGFILSIGQDALLNPDLWSQPKDGSLSSQQHSHHGASREGSVSSAQLTIGPALEDGFYYDFAFDRPFTPEDLEKIEARAIEITKRGLTVSRSELSKEEAVKFFFKTAEKAIKSN